MPNLNIVAAGAATRWQPGRSGNPGGRPKVTTLASMLREIMTDQVDPGDVAHVLGLGGVPGDHEAAASMTNADLVARAVFDLALNRTGKVPPAVQLKAVALIWSYLDGHPAVGRVEHDVGEAVSLTHEQIIAGLRHAVGGQSSAEAPGPASPSTSR